ncbi:hypothetical protein KR018_006433, partial [Drosophila ironensis]
RLNWKWNLRVLASNLYMHSAGRLPGACIPKCLHNNPQCVEKHRCAPVPDAPTFSATQSLRNTLHGQHYDTFLDILETMAMQCVCPGEGTLNRLIDMAMVRTSNANTYPSAKANFPLLQILIAKDRSIKSLREIYHKVIRTFYLLVDTFPPCWTALRPFYLNFLTVQDPSVHLLRSQHLPNLLQFYLDLMEETLQECKEEELREDFKFYEKFEFNYSEEEDANISQESMFLRHVQQYDWQSGKLCLDDFKRMSAPVRMARLCDVLGMLTWVLEREFLTWLEHNRLRQAESEMFRESNKPFAAIVFQMTASNRLTDIVKQTMKLYGMAAAKEMFPDRLRVLERLISLIVEVSNTSELRYVDNAVIYPSLGPQTRNMISEFFKIFKSENPIHLSTYVKIIPKLQQPYLRFEFTDHFLSLFYFSKNVFFGVEKVCDEFVDKQWLKYKPRAEIEDDDAEALLAREDYLKLLLDSLKDYEQWMTLSKFWKCLKTREQVRPLQTRTASPLATPVGVVTGDQLMVFMLDDIEKEVHTWKMRMNSKVILGRPKVNLPVARINVPTMCTRYGENVRQLQLLRSVLRDNDTELDVSEWLAYLEDILGPDEPASQSETAA